MRSMVGLVVGGCLMIYAVLIASLVMAVMLQTSLWLWVAPFFATLTALLALLGAPTCRSSNARCTPTDSRGSTR